MPGALPVSAEWRQSRGARSGMPDVNEQRRPLGSANTGVSRRAWKR